jgi:ubiquinone/menaquinone biosynthesis C-methylase UbiE
MDTSASEISSAQKASWNKFSPGWQKWDTLFMGFLEPHGQAIIDQLKPDGSAVVLDIAAGTGEPGLSISRRLSGGKVVMTDLADGMLQVARDKAAAAGATNVEFQLADACQLPFEDNTFDAVSCRLGYMFFPDMAVATREMRRVLKPGGRIATTVWGAPEKNFWITCMMQSIKKHIDMPPPQPGAPGMFRCSQPGLVGELFAGAGLKNVCEADVPCKLRCDSAESYWTMMTEIAAPFVAALSGADKATVEAVKTDVVAAMHARYPDAAIGACGMVIAGTK